MRKVVYLMEQYLDVKLLLHIESMKEQLKTPDLQLPSIQSKP